MITGLFSIFDPSNSTLGINWLIISAPLIIATTNSIYTSNATIAIAAPLALLGNESETAIKNINTTETTKIITTLFLTVAALNAWSLIPSTFGPTTQISVNLPIAFSAWASSIIFFSIINTNKTLAHLVPLGTPSALIPLIVIIELTSNAIRPITLSVRLTANMVAGHILISLTEEFIQSGSSPIPVSATAISILTILESGVALIQSYIFVTLVTMYLSENH